MVDYPETVFFLKHHIIYFYVFKFRVSVKCAETYNSCHCFRQQISLNIQAVNKKFKIITPC